MARDGRIFASHRLIYWTIAAAVMAVMAAAFDWHNYGKTTISQLVTRMYDVRSGAVRIGGQDVGALHRRIVGCRRR